VARASTDNLVEVLADLGYLHLDNPRRGDELGEDEQAFAYDFRAERLRADIQVQFTAPASPNASDDELDLSVAAAERQRADRERIAGRLGGGTPPPPANPDVHAWYQPIHYFAQGWGIFVRETGIQTVAEAMAPFIHTARDPLQVAAETQRMAHVALRLHETFHHKVESAAIRMETISMLEKYEPYDDAVFRPLFQAASMDLLEEGLANSWMYGQLSVGQMGIPWGRQGDQLGTLRGRHGDRLGTVRCDRRLAPWRRLLTTSRPECRPARAS
jgi:hypothetical protein